MLNFFPLSHPFSPNSIPLHIFYHRLTLRDEETDQIHFRSSFPPIKIRHNVFAALKKEEKRMDVIPVLKLTEW